MSCVDSVYMSYRAVLNKIRKSAYFKEAFEPNKGELLTTSVFRFIRMCVCVCVCMCVCVCVCMYVYDSDCTCVCLCDRNKANHLKS